MDTHFDADKLDKILTNLVGNAIKYTEEGGTVSVNVKVTGSIRVNKNLTRDFKPFILSQIQVQGSLKTSIPGYLTVFTRSGERMNPKG